MMTPQKRQLIGFRVPVVGALALAGVAFGGPASAQIAPDITTGLSPSTVDPDGIAISRDTGSPGDRHNEVEDNCLPPEATNARLLQLGLRTKNDGYAELGLGAIPPDPLPGEDPHAHETPIYMWQASHHHYHLRDFSRFLIVAATPRQPGFATPARGNVASGAKYGFHLANNDFALYRGVVGGCPPAEQQYWGNQLLCPPPYLIYSETTMGVSPGCADLYGLGLPCQFVRLDGVPVPGDPDPSHTMNVPDGIYELVAEENQARLVPEGRYYNNVTALRIQITGDVVTPLPPLFESTAEYLGPPSGVASAPSVVSRDINTYDLFYVGSDGALHEIQQGTTGTWSPADGSDGALVFDPAHPNTQYALAGMPAAVAGARDRIDVFARSTTGGVYLYSWTGGVWHVGSYGFWAGAPVAATASSPTNLMTVWAGWGSNMVYGVFNGTTWSAPTALAGTFPTDQTPALAASGVGMYHAFMRDAAGGVQYARYENGQWTAWRNLGGSIQGNVAAASPYLNRVDVFVRSTDNRLLRATWDGFTDTFTSWIDDGITNVGSSPTALSTGPLSLDVFFYDTRWNGTMAWRRHYDGTLGPPAANWSTENLGRVIGTVPGWPIVAASWADHTLDMFQNWSTGQLLVRSLR